MQPSHPQSPVAFQRIAWQAGVSACVLFVILGVLLYRGVAGSRWDLWAVIAASTALGALAIAARRGKVDTNLPHDEEASL